MKLADIYKSLREIERADDESRTAWQRRLVAEGMRLLRQAGLIDDAARKWLEKAAQDITAGLIKTSGIMPRVAAGQVLIWPEMAAIDGRNALKAYVRKYKRVVSRHEYCARMLGYLNASFEGDKDLAKQPDLRSALVYSGVSGEDIARLGELVEAAA